MSLKTAADPAAAAHPAITPARPRRQPSSLAFRLAVAFAAAAFCIVLATTTLLYWALATSLAQDADEDLAARAAEVTALLKSHPAGPALQQYADRVATQPIEATLVRVIDRHGAVVAESPGTSALLPGLGAATTAPVRYRHPRPGASLAGTDRHPYRVLAAWVRSGPPVASDSSVASDSYLVQVAIDLEPNEKLLKEYRGVIWLVLAAGLTASALAGHAIARRGLAPIERMARTMRHVGAGTLNQRIVPRNFPRELSSLAETFNDMLARIEDAFSRLSRFSADIAHELRTPINNVRGLAEVALSHARSDEELNGLLGPCLEECQRLSRLIDNLLFLARAEHPESNIRRQPVDVRAELEKIRDFYEASASSAGVAVRVRPGQPVTADLDRLLFQRALANLVENAIAHTPRGGEIELAADAHTLLRVSVRDTGTGIPPERLPVLFERFRRLDAERLGSPGGVGLGLAIVKSIAALHGGHVRATSAVGAGSTFTLLLPLSPPPPSQPPPQTHSSPQTGST